MSVTNWRGYTELSVGQADLLTRLHDPPRSIGVTIYEKDSPLLDKGYKALDMPASTRTIVSVGIGNRKGADD